MGPELIPILLHIQNGTQKWNQDWISIGVGIGTELDSEPYIRIGLECESGRNGNIGGIIEFEKDCNRKIEKIWKKEDGYDQFRKYLMLYKFRNETCMGIDRDTGIDRDDVRGEVAGGDREDL